MSLQASIRGDLCRTVLRFAAREQGVLVEPASGPGAVLAGWGDDCGLFVHDVTAVITRPCRLLIPQDFVDALAKAVRAQTNPGEIRVLVSSDATVTLGSLAIANAAVEPKPSPWRSEVSRHGVTRLRQQSMLFRRDVMESVNEAARGLARAAGCSASQAERAEYQMHGAQDGALVATFEDFGKDAFALIARTQPPADAAWSWAPPAWLAAPSLVGVVEGSAA